MKKNILEDSEKLFEFLSINILMQLGMSKIEITQNLKREDMQKDVKVLEEIQTEEELRMYIVKKNSSIMNRMRKFMPNLAFNFCSEEDKKMVIDYAKKFSNFIDEDVNKAIDNDTFEKRIKIKNENVMAALETISYSFMTISFEQLVIKKEENDNLDYIKMIIISDFLLKGFIKKMAEDKDIVEEERRELEEIEKELSNISQIMFNYYKKSDGLETIIIKNCIKEYINEAHPTGLFIAKKAEGYIQNKER